MPCGGSAVPESLLKRFDDLGIDVVQAWGMTETAPLVTLSRPRSSMQGLSAAQRRAIRAKQGTAAPFVDLRIVDDNGRELPWDGASVGELQVRGPWIVGEYYNDERSASAFQDGWFKTGDIATIDADGYVQITDRAKDVIKSGGEWISSVELENAIMAHPEVLEGEALQEYIDLRRGLGYKMHCEGLLLPRFVSFLEAHHTEHISVRLTVEWAQCASVQPAEWARRLCFVRGFARHRSATDSRTEIPPLGLLPHRY